MKAVKKGFTCLFYPDDDFKMFWDLFITIVLLVACVLTPLNIAFDKIYQEDKKLQNKTGLNKNDLLLANTTAALNYAQKVVSRMTTLKTSEIVVDSIFLIDIFVIFNSAYYQDEVELIEDRATICCEYLKGWFVIDVLSILPIDLIFNIGGFTKIVRIAKVGRMIKLVKLTRLARILKLVRQ